MNFIEIEKDIVSFMIKYYCNLKHKKLDLCSDCKGLIEYSLRKLSLCRYGINKPRCNKCKTHCYSQDKRIQIKTVMKSVGPIMIFIRPLKTLFHLFR